MSELQGYLKFQKMIADFGAQYMGPSVEAYRAGEQMNPDDHSEFISIFKGFTEITATLDALDLIEALIRTAPPRSKKIDKEYYIKFLAGSHLQEVYILNQRLEAYTKKVSRLYKQKKLEELVRPYIYEPLQAIISTRGAHVHQQRYSDNRLDDVSTWAILRRAGHEYGENLEFSYKMAQTSWLKTSRGNKSQILKIIDTYFKIIEEFMCKNGEIFIPEKTIKKD